MTFRALSFAPAVLALALHGCGGGTPIGSGRSGDVRLINATVDQGALDLYNGETRIASAVGTESAGGYADVGTGSRTLSLRLASSGAQLASTTADISRDAHYAVLAYSSAGAAASVVLAEDEAAPADGNAKIRIFNAASADAGALGAYLSPTGCTGLGASNAVATSATASAPSAWTTVGALSGGTRYHLCVTAAGDTTDLRLDLSSLTLSSRQVTTVALTATPGGVLVNALLVDQQGAVVAQRNATARLRVVADAANKAAVSVTANGNRLASNAASPSVGLYTAVTAGALTADVRIAGAAVAADNLTAPAGADLTLLVAGTAAAPTVKLYTDDNRLSTATSAPTRLRLLHGVNGLGDGLSLTADLVPVASNVAFGEASTPVNVAGLASATIQVTWSSMAQPYSLTGASTLRPGVYTMFMLGDAGAVTGVLRPDRLAAPAAAVSSPSSATSSAAR